MSPIYDILCEQCEDITEEFLNINEEPTVCVKCKSKRHKMPGGHFKLSYNNQTDCCDWAGNSSQYWNEVKRQRAEGKDVRGHNEPQ